MEKFSIKVYSIKELATFYFPHYTSASASCHLKRWMKKEPLFSQLKGAGYEPGQQVLTPKQVRLIVDHVDYPEEQPNK